MAFFFQTNDALFATSKASCIIRLILDQRLPASNSARVPNYLSTDNSTNSKPPWPRPHHNNWYVTALKTSGIQNLWLNCGPNGAVRLTSPSIRIRMTAIFYGVTKERHSVRAASRLSLNVQRFESDLCKLNRLWKEAWMEANFCRLCIRLNRSMALSRRRKGKCEFSTLLFAHRLVTCLSEQPSSLAAAT